MTKFDPLIPFRQAAIMVFGPDDVKNNSRRLKRMVLAREAQLGKKIATRDRAGGVRWITVGNLQRHFPELIPARVDKLAEAVRPALARFGEKMSQDITAITQRLAELEILLIRSNKG